MFFCPAGAIDFIEAQGFNHISAKIIVRRLDGRMALVPEGPHDSSQARSAWTAVWTFRESERGKNLGALPMAQGAKKV
jgi:hypothetical protein